jgi:hypothetical protein
MVRKSSSAVRLCLLLVPFLFFLTSCCDDNPLTYPEAMQRLENERQVLFRLTVERQVAAKKFNLETRTAPEENRATYIAAAQKQRDERVARLTREIEKQRLEVRAAEKQVAKFRR